MQRRDYLATVGVLGTVTLAGCSSDSDDGENGGENGGEDELYETGNNEELVPNGVGGDWPDQDFERDDDFNSNYLRSFLTPSGDIVILIDAEIEETVSDAEDSFESSKATAANDEEYPLADESFITDNGEIATCYWRNINATGQVAAVRESANGVQPDRQRATNYAEITFENHWQ